MLSRNEIQLQALIDDEIAIVPIISKVDRYLQACCEGCGCEGLPEPVTRKDKLLYELVEKLSNGVKYGTTTTTNANKITIPSGKNNFVLQVAGEEHQQQFVCTVILLPNNAAVVFDFGNSYCANTPEQVFIEYDKDTGTIGFSNQEMVFKTDTNYIYAAW